MMRAGFPRFFSLCAAASLAGGLVAAPAFAGGPLDICGFQAVTYPAPGTIALNYDLGPLGTRSKAQADALTTAAVALWTNVPTASVVFNRGPDLPEDVTSVNYATYYNNSTDGLFPVIYDSDGGIIDAVFGAGAKGHIGGFAESAVDSVNCRYLEGHAVINGAFQASDSELGTTLAHEMGHVIGLDHVQLDARQGLQNSNFPLMYPIAFRDTLSLHEDDAATVSDLYPEPATFDGTYGRLIGAFREAGGAVVKGANIWAREISTGSVYSTVSDGLQLGTGSFRLTLPAGIYTLHAEAVDKRFVGGSRVGPYASSSTDASFQAPLYVGTTAMAPLTLGNTVPLPIVITAGCTATATFIFDGTGTVAGNCNAGPAPGVLRLVQNAYSVNEGGTVSIPVLRTGGDQGTVSVQYTSGGGTATPNADYPQAANSGTLTWASGNTATKFVVVSATADGIAEGNGETFNFTLSNPTGGAVLGAPAAATVTIIDTDVFPVNCNMPAGWVTSTGAAAGWGVDTTQAAEGRCSLKSNPIGPGQRAQVEFTAFFPMGGNITFRRRVDSLNGFAFFRFYLDDHVQGFDCTEGNPFCSGNTVLGTTASGATDWLQPAGLLSFAVMPGAHTLKFSYETSTFCCGGANAAWLDALKLPTNNPWPASTLALSATPNPSNPGQPVSFTATVAGGAGTATGLVEFTDAATGIDLCPPTFLVSGTATCTTNALAAGSHTIAAWYPGDPSHGGKAGQATQTVNAAASTVTLASSANPSQSGQAVDFTATVSGAAGTPTGTVTFVDGGTALTDCTALPLTGAMAVCSTSALTVGQHNIVAQYPGDSVYAGDNSDPLAQTVITNAPGAPVIGAAVPGDGQATIDFTPPTSSGSSAIVSYTATCTPGPVSAQAAAAPITVTNLTNGTAYTCTVTATNASDTGPASAGVGVTPQAAGPAFALTGVVSRKTHGAAGTFDLAIDAAQPLAGPVSVESRALGAGHNIVFQFNAAVTSLTAATALDSGGLPVGAVATTLAGNELTVTLTGVPDNQRLSVSVTGVNGALDVNASLGFLVGDVNNTRSVNSSDISGVKARSGQATDTTNFKFDLNTSGAVNSSDISAVKARSGQGLNP